MRESIQVSAVAAAQVTLAAEFKLKNDRVEVRGLRSRI